MKKITQLQFGSFIYMICLSNCLGTTLNILFTVSKQDSWISIILGGIIGIIPIYIITKIMAFKPEVSILEKNRILFGKILGNILNFVFALVFILWSILALWDLNNFISSQYLHMTPSFLIGIFVIITMIYMLIKDLKVIGRVSFILFIIGFSLYLFGFFGLISQLNMEKIKPIFENNFIETLKGGFLCMAYNILPLFVLTIIPKKDIDVKNLNKLFWKWFLFAAVVIFIIVFLIVSIFGYKLSSLYQYAAFHLLKNISLFGFIDRVESTISIRWIFYLIIIITLCLYFVIEYFRDTFKIKDKKKINIVISIFCVLVLIASEIIFANNTVKDLFTLNYFSIISIVCLGFIPIIIWIRTKFFTSK